MFKDSEFLFTKGLTLVEALLGKDDYQYLEISNNLASLYKDLGRLEDSERMYLNCLNSIEKNGQEINTPTHAYFMTNLANVYLRLKHYEKAEALHLKALGILKNTVGDEHADYLLVLNNLSNVYEETGKRTEAEKLLLTCIELSESKLGKQHDFRAQRLCNLGTLYLNWGRLAEAEKYFLESKEIFESNYGSQHYLNVVVNYNLAQVYAKTNKKSELVQTIDTTIRFTHQLLRNAHLYSSEYDLERLIRQERPKLLLGSSFLTRDSVSEQLTGIAYDDALFQKGFLQNAARRLNSLTAQTPATDSLSNLLKSYRFLLSREYTKPLSAHSQVDSLEIKANRIEQDLARLLSGYATNLHQVKWQDVKNALKQGEAAIEFLNFPAELFSKKDSMVYGALIIQPSSSFPVFVELGSLREIEAIIDSKLPRKADYVDRLYTLQHRGLVEENGDKARSLYELIWAPLEKFLSNVNTIYYSNTGLLHRINLGAIPISFDSILFDKYNLVQLRSTRSVALPEIIEVKSKSALIYGDITYEVDSTLLNTTNTVSVDYGNHTRGRESLISFDYTKKTTNTWNKLPYTKLEAEKLTTNLKKSGFKVSLLTKSFGSEESFYAATSKNSDSPTVIHFATHGFFLPDPRLLEGGDSDNEFEMAQHPMIRSGLLLAGANNAWKSNGTSTQGSEDGILTAYEISQTNLTNTELVVLSACETGLGDIKGDEGVYGLQRAFKIAGVKYLIMSLWQVPDQQTSTFMTFFYKNWLDEGLTVPEAFRRTQKEMRDRFVDPFAWAGFVLIE